MPQLESYISQRGLPERSNTPQAPLSLEAAPWSALAQGAEQAQQDTTYLLTLKSYRENRMREVEQTNSAGQVLMGARSTVVGLADKLRDVNDPDFGSFSPAAKKARYNVEVQRIYRDAINKGQSIGNIGFSYVATHLPSYLSSHVEGFNKEMDILRHEGNKYQLGQNIINARDRSISADTREESEAALGEMADMVHSGVQAGLYKADEGASKIKEEGLYARKNRLVRAASNNPEEFLLGGGSEQLKDTLNPTDYNDVMGQVRQTLSDRQSKVDRDRQEAERLRTQVHNENRKQGEIAIIQNEINNESDLVSFSQGSSLNAEGLSHLRTFIHQKNTEPVVTDKNMGPRMWGSLDSMDTTKWVTIPQVREAVRYNKMNYREGIELIQAIEAKKEKWSNKSLTVYHQNAQEGEQTVSQLMDPFAGGPLDMDKLGAAYKAMALQTYRDLVAKGEKEPNAANPLDVAATVSASYYKSLARQGKVLWDKSELMKSLPLPGGGKIDTMEKLNKARADGAVNDKQYVQASRWLMLLDAVAEGEAEAVKQAKPTTTSTTEGGRGREKR